MLTISVLCLFGLAGLLACKVGKKPSRSPSLVTMLLVLVILEMPDVMTASTWGFCPANVDAYQDFRAAACVLCTMC